MFIQSLILVYLFLRTSFAAKLILVQKQNITLSFNVASSLNSSSDYFSISDRLKGYIIDEHNYNETLSESFHVHLDKIVSIQSVPWHLDILDQRSLPLDGVYAGNTFDPTIDLSSIDVFMFDTGINIHHPEFSGRNVNYFWNYVYDGINTDCNNHGTGTASLVGGNTLGVAPGVDLFAVKVLDCAGYGSVGGIIRAINDVTKYAKSSGKITIINMSFGGADNVPVLNDFISDSMIFGLKYVIAAGNNNFDACNVSPANAPNAITVASSDIDDNRSSFSNYGRCVSIYAPGQDIIAATIGGYSIKSGTSLSSAITSGMLAINLVTNNDFLSTSTPNQIKNNIPDTPNLFVYYNFNRNTTITTSIISKPTQTQTSTPTPISTQTQTSTPTPTPISTQTSSSTSISTSISTSTSTSTISSLPTESPSLCGNGILGYCLDGLCCSKYGYCGTGSEYCSSPPSSTPTCGDGIIGSCSNGLCCSKYGYCGTGSEYCSSPPSSPTCGNGVIGSCSNGLCCSKYGYCGIGSEYCNSLPSSSKCGNGVIGSCSEGLCCSKYGYCGTGSNYC